MVRWLFTCDPAYSAFVALFLCLLFMLLWCTLALLNYSLEYFGVAKLSFVILVCYVVSCNFGLLCCLLVVWRCWLGLSCSLLELSPAGRGWCLVGERLFISLLVYFGVVKLNFPCFLFLFCFNWTLAPALLPGPFVSSDRAPLVSWGVSRLLIFCR